MGPKNLTLFVASGFATVVAMMATNASALRYNRNAAFKCYPGEETLVGNWLATTSGLQWISPNSNEIVPAFCPIEDNSSFDKTAVRNIEVHVRDGNSKAEVT